MVGANGQWMTSSEPNTWSLVHQGAPEWPSAKRTLENQGPVQAVDQHIRQGFFTATCT